jgi:hypothetical protein
MTHELPAFDTAIASFRDFISRQDQPPDIRWIFREDIVELGRQVYICLPLSDAEEQVRQLYAEGVERGLGINLHAYCFLDAHTLCYIWLPKDEVDADYRMLGGLKFSMSANPEQRKAIGVTSGLRWRWLRCLESRRSQHNWADDIPHRQEKMIEVVAGDGEVPPFPEGK